MNSGYVIGAPATNPLDDAFERGVQPYTASKDEVRVTNPSSVGNLDKAIDYAFGELPAKTRTYLLAAVMSQVEYADTHHDTQARPTSWAMPDSVSLTLCKATDENGKGTYLLVYVDFCEKRQQEHQRQLPTADDPAGPLAAAIVNAKQSGGRCGAHFSRLDTMRIWVLVPVE